MEPLLIFDIAILAVVSLILWIMSYAAALEGIVGLTVLLAFMAILTASGAIVIGLAS